MAISREEAFDIALAHLESERSRRAPSQFSELSGRTQLRSIRSVLSVDEVVRPPLVYGLRAPLETCWIAYLESSPTAIQSSRVVLVSKESGKVLYFGSANDEG